MKKNSAFTLILIMLLSCDGLKADTLEDYGWEKVVDDFEGTTLYRVSHGNYAFSCDTATLATAFGLVNGELGKAPLTLALYFTNTDELRREGELKWKTNDGTRSLEFACDNDYDDGGWNRQCIVPAIDIESAESLANTDFIRLDFPSTNIDLKKGSESNCSKLYDATVRIASEYISALKNN
tara:strand:+ start:604 stop:1146 length:543 start_codon:yes stop_codon:yes gene_type:complete